jgi:hypothetical protein
MRIERFSVMALRHTELTHQARVNVGNFLQLRPPAQAIVRPTTDEWGVVRRCYPATKVGSLAQVGAQTSYSREHPPAPAPSKSRRQPKARPDFVHPR